MPAPPPPTGSRPTVHTLACHPELRGAVMPYFSCEITAAPFTRQLVPDGSVDVLFSLDGSYGQRPDAVEPEICVAGAVTSPVAVQRPAGSLVIGVSFAPGAAAGFLGVPLHHLTDRVCDVREMWGRDAGDLLDQLRDAAPAARGGLLDSFLLRKRAAARVPDPALMAGVELIRAHGGRLSMRALAERLGVPERRLERLFLAGVGVSPKKLARIARLHAVLGRLAHARAASVPWGMLAIEFGFADQAHLIREFRQLVGTTPASYARDDARSHTFSAGLTVERPSRLRA
jgi:AraC-like DNA-binding protein